MCTRRNFLLFVCSLQLLTIIERQVFDFLGHLWLPILVNFLHMIFIIFGFFGAYQFRTKYLISYSTWNVLWIGWNAFIICFYLSVGILDRDSDILNFGTGTVSWFESNGPGCKPIYPTNATLEDPFRLIRPERVDGCLLDYPIVEVVHSGVQSFLAFLGLIGAICICCSIWNDDDSLRRNDDPKRQSLYTIEFGAPVDAIRGDPGRDDSLSPKPMTPRRVKRRSVRGTSSRQSRRSDRGAGSSGTHRSSTRSSRRKIHQNPVTKLIEQQNSFPSFKHNNNPTLTENNLKSLNNDYVVNNQYQSTNLMPSKPQPALNSFQKQQNSVSNAAINRHTPTDPIYYNMNSSSPLLVQQTSWNATSTPSPQAYNSHYYHHHPNDAATSLGHTNPTYQHSNPNLADGPEMNEYYQSTRPPSVRSSYSNFHGTRPLSYNPGGGGGSNNTQENLFASLAQQQQQQQHQQQLQGRPQSILGLDNRPSVPPRGGVMPNTQQNVQTGYPSSVIMGNSAAPDYSPSATGNENGGNGFFDMFSRRQNGGSKRSATLETPPQVLRPEGKMTDRERIEIEVVKLLLSSYFNIVKRTVKDLCPKSIMLNLVQYSRDNLQRTLLAELYSRDVLDRVLTEADHVVTRRRELRNLLKALESADEIVKSVS